MPSVFCTCSTALPDTVWRFTKITDAHSEPAVTTKVPLLGVAESCCQFAGTFSVTVCWPGATLSKRAKPAASLVAVRVPSMVNVNWATGEMGMPFTFCVCLVTMTQPSALDAAELCTETELAEEERLEVRPDVTLDATLDTAEDVATEATELAADDALSTELPAEEATAELLMTELATEELRTEEATEELATDEATDDAVELAMEDATLDAGTLEAITELTTLEASEAAAEAFCADAMGAEDADRTATMPARASETTDRRARVLRTIRKGVRTKRRVKIILFCNFVKYLRAGAPKGPATASQSTNDLNAAGCYNGSQRWGVAKW